MDELHDSDGDPRVFLSRWGKDLWLPGYQQLTAYFMETDDEGQIIATFVRKNPDSLTAAQRWRRWVRGTLRRKPAAILYVHGWNDHFYRIHASEFWESLGVRFYAVDLAKFGRSYRPGQTPGYTEDLHGYFPQLDALRDTIVKECGDDVRILVIGHSMGGLITSLWMHHRRPHHVTALMLNSPWLELQLTRFGRLLTTPVVRGFRMVGGKTVMPLNDPGFYGRTLYRSQGGLWDYERYQEPGVQYVARAGWMNAIYNAQDEVAHGLDIQVPVLVCTSDKSMLQTRWDPGMAKADTVLDVQSVRAAAVGLGKVVTLVQIPDALHDISMSCPEARRLYFRIAARWAMRWAWDDSWLPARVLDKALDAVAASHGDEGWPAEGEGREGADGDGSGGDDDGEVGATTDVAEAGGATTGAASDDDGKPNDVDGANAGVAKADDAADDRKT